MDGFTAANVFPDDPTGSRAMGYYTKDDLPFYYKLYKTFASSDRFFCSLLSQTFPNRYYLLAATSFGQIRNTFPDLSDPEMDPADDLQPPRRSLAAGQLEGLLLRPPVRGDLRLRAGL